MWIVTVCLATHQHGLELGQPGPHAPGHRRCAHALPPSLWRRAGAHTTCLMMIFYDPPASPLRDGHCSRPTAHCADLSLSQQKCPHTATLLRLWRGRVCRLHPPVLPGRRWDVWSDSGSDHSPASVSALPAASPARVPSTAQASVLSSLHRLRRRLRSPPTDFQHTWRLSAVPTAAPRPP